MACTPADGGCRGTPEEGRRLAAWWRAVGPPAARWRRGPATFCPAAITNETDFASMEPVCEVPAHLRFSFADAATNRLFAADLRSMWGMLVAGEEGGAAGGPAALAGPGPSPLNPYTREPLSAVTLARLRRHAAWAATRGLPTRWEATAPASPEQELRMAAVDLFARLDALEHYTDAEWFLGLDAVGHRRLYTELHDIWTHRAELTAAQRRAMVGGRGAQPLFPTHPSEVWLLDRGALARMTLAALGTMVTAPAERADRVLCAMYAVTALTLVAAGAREAYPYLYESVAPGVTSPGGGGLLRPARAWSPPWLQRGLEEEEGGGGRRRGGGGLGAAHAPAAGARRAAAAHGGGAGARPSSRRPGLRRRRRPV